MTFFFLSNIQAQLMSKIKSKYRGEYRLYSERM